MVAHRLSCADSDLGARYAVFLGCDHDGRAAGEEGRLGRLESQIWQAQAELWRDKIRIGDADEELRILCHVVLPHS